MKSINFMDAGSRFSNGFFSYFQTHLTGGLEGGLWSSLHFCILINMLRMI